MNVTITRGFLLSAMLLSAVAAAGEGRTYEIVLDRPTEVGATYRVVASGTNLEQMVVSKAGVVVDERKSDVAVDLTASVVVLGIDEQGRTSKLRFVVESSGVRGVEGRSELFARGTEVVVAVDDGAESYTVGDEPVAADVAKLLKLVNSLPTTDATDDEVFGTRERKKVGDSWPIDAARAAESFREPGLTISDDGVTGETKFVEVARIGGSEVLKVEAKIVMDGIGVEMPEGFRVTEGRLEADFKGTFPVEPARRKLDEALTASMALSAVGTAGPGGPEVTIAVKGRRTRTTKFLER